ncbi:MAG TPA: PIN domain-containing protein [Bryobacteraceae bacterium]|jgi:predicted nucleic acid-binding protein
MPPEFVDTNILIYAHDGGAGAKHKTAEGLVSRLSREFSGALSTQILIEFYDVATRKLGRPKEQLAEIVSDFGGWTIHRPEHADVLAAIRLHQRYKLSWWDTLVLHSAHSVGCEILWTEDFTHGQRYGSVTVRNPFR